MIRTDTNDIVAAIGEVSTQIGDLYYRVGRADERILECEQLAQEACAGSNNTYAPEPDINLIANLVVDLVTERVMERVWKMIDDAKSAPSEKEFLTGIERLFLQ